MKDNVWLGYEENDLKAIDTLAEEYKAFLSTCKTEREMHCIFSERSREGGLPQSGGPDRVRREADCR